jgi:Magnesium chelatase, subunit ChlI C-terminal
LLRSALQCFLIVPKPTKLSILFMRLLAGPAWRSKDRRGLAHARRNLRKGSVLLPAALLSGLKLLKMAMNELKLSARAYDRILKVARTIADLAGSDRLRSHSVSFVGPAIVGLNRYAEPESHTGRSLATLRRLMPLVFPRT